MGLESTAHQARNLALPTFRPYLSSLKRAYGKQFPKVLFGFYATLSMVLPLVALSLYRANLESKGIFVESGCHGPDAFFGSLTGIIFCLLLRFGYDPFFPLDGKN